MIEHFNCGLSAAMWYLKLTFPPCRPRKPKKAREYDTEFVRKVEEKIRALTIHNPEPPEAEAPPLVAEALPAST
jgi:hypothetical protein